MFAVTIAVTVEVWQRRQETDTFCLSLDTDKLNKSALSLHGSFLFWMYVHECRLNVVGLVVERQLDVRRARARRPRRQHEAVQQRRQRRAAQRARPVHLHTHRWTDTCALLSDPITYVGQRMYIGRYSDTNLNKAFLVKKVSECGLWYKPIKIL